MPNQLVLIEPTDFYNDFLVYHTKAEKLQNRNLGILPKDVDVQDPIMMNITIYDTIHRRYAGFSKVLEDLHYGTRRCSSPKHFNLETWFYLYIVHRLTGSGASFQKDHGYRNTILFELANLKTISEMVEFIKSWDKPMFTSLGNQIPAFPKPQNPYVTGGKYYLCEFAPRLACDMVAKLEDSAIPFAIKELVDWTLDWQTKNGCKRFKFCLTAFVMDIAEYHPELVDQNSHCYYGKNAQKAINACFKKSKPMKAEAFNEACMDQIVLDTGNKPYNLEDVACDFIRYLTEFVPKGYEYLKPEQKVNNSTLKAIYKDQYRSIVSYTLGEDSGS